MKTGCLAVVVVFIIASCIAGMFLAKNKTTNNIAPAIVHTTPAPTPQPQNINTWAAALQQEANVWVDVQMPAIHLGTRQCNARWLPEFLKENNRDAQIRQFGVKIVRCGIDREMNLMEYRTDDSPPLAEISPSSCLWEATTNSANTPESRTLEAEAMQGELVNAGLRSIRITATGTRNTTMHITGVANCDDATLRRIFPRPTVQGYVSNFQIYCTAQGFHGIECVPNHGQTRVIDYQTACRCTGGTECQCLF